MVIYPIIFPSYRYIPSCPFVSEDGSDVIAFHLSLMEIRL